MIQVIDWLNENEFRAYPLMERGNRVIGKLKLDNFILDASLNTVTVSQTAPISVRLTEIQKTDDAIVVKIEGQDDFTASLSSFPAYIRNDNGSLLVLGEKCLQIPDKNYTFTDVYFEPSVVNEFSGPWNGVTKLVAGTTELTGIVNLIEGHQIDITLTPGIIQLAAGYNYGLPVTCDDIPPEDKACAEIISYINGATPLENPGNIILSPGTNVRVYDDPDNHRIYIGLAFESEDICKSQERVPKAVVT